MTAPSPSSPSTGRPDLSTAAYGDLAEGPSVLWGDAPTAQVARVWNRWCGGRDGYAEDRRTADAIARLLPGITTTARDHHRFMVDVVSELAVHGIDQFLDIGCGLPVGTTVHEAARVVCPGARTVHVDRDPIVAAHVRALTTRDPHVAVALADLRAPHGLLADPVVEAHLDAGRPIGVLLLGVLHFVADADEPDAVLGRLVEALAPGSVIVMTHAAPQRPEAAAHDAERRRWAEALEIFRRDIGPITLRSVDEVRSWTRGLQVIEPASAPWLREHVERAAGGQVPLVTVVGRV